MALDFPVPLGAGQVIKGWAREGTAGADDIKVVGAVASCVIRFVRGINT